MVQLSVRYEDTPFLETSETHPQPNRLNWRCEMLLTQNIEAIRGKRILDMASHDGRFSYACLKLGAKHVTGIEGRSHLINSAKKNLALLGYDLNNFSFLHGDIFEFLGKFESGDFDTILCFGFFYHTIKQVELLHEIKRLCPQYFILDTCVQREDYVIKLLRLRRKFRLKHILPRNLQKLLVSLEERKLVFKFEDSCTEGKTIDPSGMVAIPTKPLIEALLRLHGFNFCQINWHDANIKSWEYLEDYRKGKRISYAAQLAPQPSKKT